MREAIPNSANKKASLAEQVEWAQSLELYEQYVSELRLSHEDLNKRILDVGADFGHFAETAKQKGYSDIYSIDIAHPADKYNMDSGIRLGAEKMAVADAFQLPFKNETFDLAVSFCAMPNLVKGSNPIDYQKEVKKVFQEMLRVTKVGGEIRLGRVVSEYQRDELLRRGEQIQKALQWFKARRRRFETSTEATGDINGNPAYLIRIKKLS